MSKYERGSEWRKWDLHVHTKDTHKNDNFTSSDFNSFCITLFKKALDKDIKAIGITDYFDIENYKKVKKFVDNINSCDDFNEQEKKNIKQIFLLPNVELRMLPVTDRGRLINIHCIFNPDSGFLTKLVNDFFGSLEDSNGNKMNKDGLIALGKSSNNNLDDVNAYKKGIEEFHLEPSALIKLFKNKSSLKENTIISVSNSSYDGASALQEHYKLFENENSSLNEIRSNIYKLSDAIFSSNPKDRDFFLGKKEGSDEQTVIQYCGSLKPCVHGSDAHCESELFNPDKNRFCWIKADPTFEGLKQIVYEPENRVYIGEKPIVLDKITDNATKYIDRLKINQTDDHTGDTWFKNIDIKFNRELVAIVGNKGSGKSSIADILGLVGDTNIEHEHFSFLHKNKFLKGGLANKFNAQIIWQSGGKSDDINLANISENDKPEAVRYIPQNYFEQLTNDLEVVKFQKTLEKIIFGYIPDEEKLGHYNFDELEKYKTENINREIKNQKNKITNLNAEIINLENKAHPNYLKKIKGFIEEKDREIQTQKDLLKTLPNISNPNEGQNSEEVIQKNNEFVEKTQKLTELQDKLKEQTSKKIKINTKFEALKKIKVKIKHQEGLFNEFLESNEQEVANYELDIRKILKLSTDYSSIDKLIDDTQKELREIIPFLKSVEEIIQAKQQENNKSIVWEIAVLEKEINTVVRALSAEQQAFQKNEQKKKDIKIAIQKLTGHFDNPENETLNFYKKERQFIERDLSIQLEQERQSRVGISLEIFNEKSEILELYNSFKDEVDSQILKNIDLLDDYDIKIDSSFNLKNSFFNDFLKHINQNKKGSFYGKDEGKEKIKNILENSDLNNKDDIKTILENVIKHLETDKREAKEKNRNISEQIKNVGEFYNFLFSLDYLETKYELKLGDKTLNKLSPGERGALLLIFYLIIDKEIIPLIIDQPEDNLDNESVYNMLSKFIKKAKQNRQIIIVTHNPNLAVGADAEQVIYVHIDKQDKNKFSFISGSIENIEINKKIVKVLEGTRPAFDKRKLKYQE